MIMMYILQFFFIKLINVNYCLKYETGFRNICIFTLNKFMKKKSLYILFIVPFILLSLNGCQYDSMSPYNNNGISMTLVSAFGTAGTGVNVFAKKINTTDYGFLSLGTAGMEIINITNPASPTSVSDYPVYGYSEEVFVANLNDTSYAFVAAGTGGISVLNLSNITAPTLDTILNLNGDYINSVFVDTASKMLYAGGSSRKVYIINLSNLPAIGNINTYTTFSYINEILVDNNVAYIAQDSGVDIINVTNPISPVGLAQGITYDYAYDVKKAGNYILLSNNTYGVLIINVSNPSRPLEVGVLDTYDIALACSVNGNLVYVAEDATGVETFDISNPSRPILVAFSNTSSFSENVCYFNGFVYVSDYNDYLVLRYP